jgi:hypothetical protein
LACAGRSVDGSCVRPVRLDGNDVEAVMYNQMPRDGCAGLIKLGRGMARLTEEHYVPIREPLEEGTEGVISEFR